jgi:hypothetical protein
MNNSNIPYDIRDLSRSKAVSFYKLWQNPLPDEIKPGQIWSTRSMFRLPNGQQFSTDEPRLVIILLGAGKLYTKFDSITVAPLSIHTKMASEYDLIVKGGSDNNPLTFDIMIETWNETPVLKGQLKKYICTMSEGTTKILHLLYSSRLQDEEVSEDLKKYTGMRIVAEDDPRRTFQEEETAAVAYLAKAATASLELEYDEQKEPETKNWKVFDIQPFLGKLSSILRGPAVARAANYVDNEIEGWLIVRPERNESFIFELLNSRRQPYTIYMKTHFISPDLIGLNCVISVNTKNQVLRSGLTKLSEGIKIEIGKDAHFRCKDVESVEVAIEPPSQGRDQ